MSRQEINLEIGGMHCVMCAAAVERALKKLPGVENASVSYASESAVICYDDAKVTVPAMKKCVKKAGYSVIENKADFQKREYRTLIITFVVSLVLSLPFFIMMPLMFFAPDVPLMHVLHNGWVQFAFATPVQFVIGFRFFRGAFDSIRSGSANMDVLVSMGTLCSYIYSLWQLLSGGHTFYFEASAMVITLVLLGKLFESRAKLRANDAVDSLLKLQPRRATVLRDGQEVTVNITELAEGDLVTIRPGEAVAADGEVHDPNRVEYIRRYLKSLKRAVDDGVLVEGYFYWSFWDNFEWAHGYTQRFGLTYVDFQTLERIPKDSCRFYKTVMETNGENL